MRTEITVKIKSVYGADKIYPICDTAILFCCLTGTKTLTKQHIQTIKDIGYTINVDSKSTL